VIVVVPRKSALPSSIRRVPEPVAVIVDVPSVAVTASLEDPGVIANTS